MASRQPPAAEFVRAFVATSPFARHTGLEVVDLSADRAEMPTRRTVATAIATYRYA